MSNKNQIENIFQNRERTFDEMKSTLQQSKSLLKRLVEVKDSILTPKKSQNISVYSKYDSKASKSPQSYPQSISSSTISKKPFNEFKKEPKPQKSKIQFIRQNIIGLCTRYQSPFNIELETVYVDHTATNRSYKPVQTVIEYTKRFIANPHTQFNYFGKFSTEMMHYALHSLLDSFSADPQKYVVLPVGSGSTGAIQKAIRIIQRTEDPKLKPEIFITPYEHHSNILPWVQFYGHIQTLQCDQNTIIEMDKIEDQIKSCIRKNIIVSVSAASNVTSQITDLKSLNGVIKKLRKFKNIIFAVDCAAFCCHQQLNLEVLDQIDFAFISPHKNLGGSETCGLLLARTSLLPVSNPSFPGGGTVTMVIGYQKNEIVYDMDPFARQTAGTPAFLGFYRAALSFELLKNQIGYDFIREREKHNSKLFVNMIMQENAKFKKQGLKNSIIIYGHKDFDKRKNVFTFNLVNDGNLMQHNFVSEILSDIFAIQVRSGCFCAGPFSVKLLNLDKEMIEHLTQVFELGILKQKPGYLRADITFYLEDFQVQYIAKAIALITRHIKNLQPLYTICNDGQIKRHKLLHERYPLSYNIKDWMILGQSLKKMQLQDDQRLKNRKQTLQAQLKRGQHILKDPLGFLKSQMNHKI